MEKETTVVKTVIERVCFCDRCNKKIDLGFKIIGNINVIEEGICVGGIIGNNFDLARMKKCDEKVVIRTNDYCKECLVKILTEIEK